jgi:hypothetical protein
MANLHFSEPEGSSQNLPAISQNLPIPSQYALIPDQHDPFSSQFSSQYDDMSLTRQQDFSSLAQGGFGHDLNSLLDTAHEDKYEFLNSSLDEEEDKVSQLHRTMRQENNSLSAYETMRQESNSLSAYDMLAEFNYSEPEPEPKTESAMISLSQFENSGRFRYDDYDNADSPRNNFQNHYHEEDSAGGHNAFSAQDPYSYGSFDDNYHDYGSRQSDYSEDYDEQQYYHNNGNNKSEGFKSDNRRTSAAMKDIGYDDEYSRQPKDIGYDDDAVDRYFSTDRRAMRTSQREARQEMMNMESQYESHYGDYDDYDESEKRPFGAMKIILCVLGAAVCTVLGILIFVLFS